MSLISQALMRIRAGGLYSLAQDEGVAALVSNEEPVQLTKGVYHLKSKVFGTLDKEGFGFVNEEGTLVTPHHLTQGKEIIIDGTIVPCVQINEEADVALYGGHQFTATLPMVGGEYILRNPILCEQITMQCLRRSSDGILTFIRKDAPGEYPLEGWSGLPIIDEFGNVYGFYSFHVHKNNVWQTRCYEGLVEKKSIDWTRTVEIAVTHGFADVVAGTGAGKTIGLTKAIIKKGIKNVYILQPTRVMVENLYNSVKTVTYDIGYKHSESSINPNASIVIATYGMFLQMVSHRNVRPRLVFCDEVHDTKPEIQATLLYLEKSTISRIYATATPHGQVRNHGGIYSITDSVIDVNAQNGTVLYGSVVVKPDQICKMAEQGLLIFVPAKRMCNDIKSVLDSAPFNLKNNTVIVTSDTVKSVLGSGILTSDVKKVLISTNVLESGVTIKVRHVLDFGKTSYPLIENDGLVWKTILSTEVESAQRRGRVGRISPGTYTRVENAFSPYDPYRHTYAHLAIWLKFLKIDIPDTVKIHFDGQPNLTKLIFDATEQQLRSAVRTKIDPLFALQNMDSHGNIWSKIVRQYKLVGTIPGSRPDTTTWITSNQHDFMEPRFKTEDEYFDSCGVYHTTHTSMAFGVSVGLLLASYVGHKLFKRTFSTIEGYMVCDWYEYLNMNYVVKQYRFVGGKLTATVLMTSLTGPLFPEVAATIVKYATIGTTAGFGMSELVGIGSEMEIVEENIEGVLGIKMLEWLRENVTERYGIRDKVVTFGNKLLKQLSKSYRYVSNECTEDKFQNVFSKFKDNSYLFSAFRGATLPSNFTVKGFVYSFCKGMSLGYLGFVNNNFGYLSGFLCRSLFCKTDRQFFGLILNGCCEMIGQAVALYAPDLASFALDEGSLTVLDLNIAMIAILSGSALAGLRMIDDLNVLKMSPITTTSVGNGVLAGNCLVGFLAGAGLGMIGSILENRREVRMNQVACAKSSPVLLEWMEKSGRLLFKFSTSMLKVICVSSCFMVRPLVCSGFLLSGLVLKGFNWNTLDSLTDNVPSILMLTESIRSRSYISAFWTAFGPFFSYVFVPSGVNYVVATSNAIASYTMTSGTTQSSVVPVSNSYNVACSLQEKFKFFGDVLILGEGAGGLSQYYCSKTDIKSVDSVCNQKYTIPSLTSILDLPVPHSLYDMDIGGFTVCKKYDCVFVDLSVAKSDEKLLLKVKNIISEAKPTKIVSTAFSWCDGYGSAHVFEYGGLYYHCLVRNHVAKSAPISKLETKEIEVYSPIQNYNLSALPNFGTFRLMKTAVKHFDGPKLYSVGKININRGFEQRNTLMCNSMALNSCAMREVKFFEVMSQASRTEQSFMDAIFRRVSTPASPIRTALMNVMISAFDFVLDQNKKYTTYTLAEALRTIPKTGSGSLTDTYATMGEYVDSGKYVDLTFDKDKVIWSMVPKYENRKISSQGTFPSPRVVTMSNLEFRLYCHQVLGMMNASTPVFESTGKLLFFDYLEELNKHKRMLEEQFHERYVYYSGDVAYWDSRPTVDMIVAMGEKLSKMHDHGLRVKEIFELQSKRFCVTANGLVLYKVGGVDSGSVTTKLGNDCMNAARDLAVVSVCVGESVQEVRKRIRRLVCGDDFIGVLPMRYVEKVQKHYARVSQEMGFELKNDLAIYTDSSLLSFCSHYWLPVYQGNKSRIMPYRSRKEIFERLILQPTHSVESDNNRFAQKCLAYYMLYSCDARIEKVLRKCLDEIPTFDVFVNDGVKYGLGMEMRFTKAKWNTTVMKFYKENLKIGKGFKYKIVDTSIVNRNSFAEESRILSKEYTT